KSIRIFKREVYEEDLLKAVTVTLMAVITVFSSLFIISIIEPYSTTQILFEVTSAFGTVGLTLGITGKITTIYKIILMILMFIGKVVILNFLLMYKNNKEGGKYNYTKKKLIIG